MPDDVSRIRVRPAHAADGPAIEHLHRASVRGLVASYYSPAQIESFLAGGTLDRELIEAGMHYVAELGEALVGSGGWMPVEQGPGRPWRARIRAVFVHPAWTRRGIGSPPRDPRRDGSRAGRLHDLRARCHDFGRTALPEPRLLRGRTLRPPDAGRHHLAGRAHGEGARHRGGVLRVSAM